MLQTDDNRIEELRPDVERLNVRKQTIDISRARPDNQLAQVEGPMAPTRLTETNVTSQIRKLSGIGATEDQIDMRGTIGQRIDSKGTKLEDEAGTGQIDSSGG
jgi:hypothetical protein